MKKIFVLLLLLINYSVFSQELISKNPSFQNGLTDWEYGVASLDGGNDVPDAEFTVLNEGHNDSSGCKVKVKISTDSGNLNDVYLVKRSLVLKKGKKYRVRFYIKSNTREDKITTSIGSGTVPDLVLFTNREMKFVGDNEWQKISFTFELPKSKDNMNYKDLMLMIGFNHRFGEFFVDNFSVTPL